MLIGALELTLIAAAALIGFTGTWSPCGFSMIETIGATGHSGGRPTTLAACATFFAGCLVGGILTFGALAALGGLIHGADARLAYLLAAGLALAAAVGEARGARIAPQVRRQLPEHWRRLMPMPLAAGLYGILLGLGFTTFVLTFGVWAIAGIALAVGEPMVGIAIGLAFGVGRALPIVVLAPIADRPHGIACTEAMAMRPSLYRGVRLGDAGALLVAAAALLASEPAGAASEDAGAAADPSAAGAQLAYQRVPGAAGVLIRGGDRIDLDGTDPAVGGGHVAVLRGSRIVLLDAATLDGIASVETKGTDAVAVSRRFIVYRRRVKQRDRLLRRRILAGGRIGKARSIHGVGKRQQLGQPNLHGRTLVYAVAKPRVNRVVFNRLGSRRRGTVIASPRFGLSNPSVLSRRVLYVRSTRAGHELRLKRISAEGPGRRLLKRRHNKATLWSTALAPDRAYVTLLRGRGNPPGARIVSVRR
ncbi:MAG TPA: hypothetical protein VK919_06020 [Solirubrobacterales bacterium]|nr:hypothetical protein [Solirubrobacterales bacterium]